MRLHVGLNHIGKQIRNKIPQFITSCFCFISNIYRKHLKDILTFLFLFIWGIFKDVVCLLAIIIITALFLISINSAFAAKEFFEESCTVTQKKICLDYGKRIMNGTPITDCWKYETKYTCIGNDKNWCAPLESNRGCTLVSAECLEDSPFGLCKKMDKTFSCSSKNDDLQGIKRIDTEFFTKKDEIDLSNCTKEEINKNCSLEENICINGPETRNINGLDVYKDCWEYKRNYICRNNTFIDECKDLKDKCTEVSRTCLYTSNDGQCDHYEVMYNCTGEHIIQNDCIENNFCVGGVCEKSKRNSFDDFGDSVSKLGVLAAMKSDEVDGCRCPQGKSTCKVGEIDTDSCKLFTGSTNKCSKTTSQYNCCSNKGVLTSVFKCSSEENDLRKKREANLCHYVGSYRGKGLNILKSTQSYCCFRSIIAKIIQFEGRKQLGLSWGSAKNPDCRPLSLEEIRKLDFTKMDFSDMINDVKLKSSKKLEEKKKELVDQFNKDSSKDTVSDLEGTHSNAYKDELSKDMSSVVSKKVSSFYKDMGKAK